jgi:putative hydrolase
VLDESGSIDFPKNFMPFVDLVLLGIHPNITAGKSREFYTDMLVSAIKQNPCVDIISHPNDPVYPVDYDKLAKTAQSHGIALELNNSKLLYKRTTLKETEMLIAACHINNCLLAVNTDTHAIHELGNDDAVRPILARMKFPEELIVNRTADSAADFIRKRRGFKLTKNA